MKRGNVALSLGAALAVMALAGVSAGADTSFDEDEPVFATVNARNADRRLEQVSDTLARAQARLVRLIERRPGELPPDPCSDPRAVACREVHAVEAIDAEAESLLAGVAAIDHGADRQALKRRLAYETASYAWTTVRLETLAHDWSVERPVGVPPSELPPDPCAPEVSANVELMTRSAEIGTSRAGAIDTCTDAPSVDRRLGHVVAGLSDSMARLDALAPTIAPFKPTTGEINPPDPDSVERKLDAIIAGADALAANARALLPVRLSGSEPVSHL